MPRGLDMRVHAQLGPYNVLNTDTPHKLFTNQVSMPPPINVPSSIDLTLFEHHLTTAISTTGTANLSRIPISAPYPKDTLLLMDSPLTQDARPSFQPKIVSLYESLFKVVTDTPVSSKTKAHG